MSMRQSAPAPQRAWANNNPAAMTTGGQAVVHKPSDRLAHVLNAGHAMRTGIRQITPQAPKPDAAPPQSMDPRNPTSNAGGGVDGSVFLNQTLTPMVDNMNSDFEKQSKALKAAREAGDDCEKSEREAADALVAELKKNADTTIERLTKQLDEVNELLDKCQGGAKASDIEREEFKTTIENLKRDNATEVERLTADSDAAKAAAAAAAAEAAGTAAEEIAKLNQTIADLQAKAKEENAREDEMEKSYQTKVQELADKLTDSKQKAKDKSTELGELFRKICGDLEAANKEGEE